MDVITCTSPIGTVHVGKLGQTDADSGIGVRSGETNMRVRARTHRRTLTLTLIGVRYP